MSSLLERLVQGALNENDYNQWSQEIGSAPPKEFQQAATQAVRQLPPEQYSRHIQPNSNGTTPLHRVAPDQRSGIAQTIISALLNRGLSNSAIQQNTGISTLDPRQMSPQEIASLLQWVQRNHPEVLGQTSQQYQNRPDLLHSILGNQALMGLAVGLGSQIIANQLSGGNQNRTAPNSGRVFM